MERGAYYDKNEVSIHVVNQIFDTGLHKQYWNHCSTIGTPHTRANKLLHLHPAPCCIFLCLAPDESFTLCAFYRSDKALIHAVTRHAKDQVSLDLSKCTRWLRFIDIQYKRSGKYCGIVLTPMSSCQPPCLSTSRPLWLCVLDD